MSVNIKHELFRGNANVITEDNLIHVSFITICLNVFFSRPVFKSATQPGWQNKSKNIICNLEIDWSGKKTVRQIVIKLIQIA